MFEGEQNLLLNYHLNHLEKISIKAEALGDMVTSG